MKLFFFIFLFLLVYGCNKPKTVLICGDHICINKNEAKQYFEENLSIEVQIVDKKNKRGFDLVELNLKDSKTKNKSISIASKNNTSKELKTLTKDDVIKIKNKIRNKDNVKIKEVKIKKKNLKKQNNSVQKNVNNARVDVVDICTILKKCSIEEISKYLLKEGRKKKFPDITTR